MDKPNLIESYEPCSGSYSLRKDLRLNAWLAVATVLYCAMLWLVKHHPDWSPLARGLLSLTPLLPGWFYVRTWMRLVGGMDELQRRIQLEAFLFAALGTVVVGATLSTLNASGFMPFGDWLSHGLGLGGAFIALLVLWPIGAAIAGSRYK
jgi:hypothetical protein